jgi:hypothetical protein
MRDKDDEVGTCLGAESAKEVGACLGVESAKGVGTCLGTESTEERGACLGTEPASGAPMHDDGHAGATPDLAATTVAPGVTNSGSWS